MANILEFGDGRFRGDMSGGPGSLQKSEGNMFPNGNMFP